MVRHAIRRRTERSGLETNSRRADNIVAEFVFGFKPPAYTLVPAGAVAAKDHMQGKNFAPNRARG